MIQILLVICFAYSLSFAQEQPNLHRIEDGDKTSSRINDMITGIEQAEKAAKLAMGAKEGAEAVKELANGGIKKNLQNLNLKEKGKEVLKGKVVKYKNSKQGFIKFISGITDKLSDVMNKAGNRINMWRSTEPTLIAFGESAVKMANNTIKVFSEFEPEDLKDIAPKWSREMEEKLYADKRFAMGVVYCFESSLPDSSREIFNELFLDNKVEEEMGKTTLGVRATIDPNTIHTYRSLPSKALFRAGEAIQLAGKISAQAHAVAEKDGSISIEQQDINLIEEALTDPQQTYEDAREIAAFIALKKQVIATQCTQLQQTLSLLEADLARMYLNDQEQIAMQCEQINNDLKIIGQGEPFPTLENEKNAQIEVQE